ncbi:MAG: hypothetical protein OSA84_13485 [Akkermansiaceae bacterium]|nr:hypothetical protein [Akkermansiaceae bacterium]
MRPAAPNVAWSVGSGGAGCRMSDVGDVRPCGVHKGAPEKVLIAVLLRERTSVSKGWIAQRLAMGYTGAVSRLTGMFHRDSGNTKRLRDLEEMLKLET